MVCSRPPFSPRVVRVDRQTSGYPRASELTIRPTLEVRDRPSLKHATVENSRHHVRIRKLATRS